MTTITFTFPDGTTRTFTTETLIQQDGLAHRISTIFGVVNEAVLGAVVSPKKKK